MPSASVYDIKPLAVVYLGTKEVHLNDANALNVALTLNVLEIVLVSTIIALIHAKRIHCVLQTLFASFEIMLPTANVQITYQTEIHCRIVNEFNLMLDLNAVMTTIVQANWLVFAKSVSNLAKSYRHVLQQLVAVF